MTTGPLPQPKTLGAWLALPELPMGAHQLISIGMLHVPMTEARRHELADLPAESSDLAELELPNVEVIEQNEPKTYRLGLIFGSIMRRMHEDPGTWHREGRYLLPTRYSFERLPSGDAVVQPIRG